MLLPTNHVDRLRALQDELRRAQTMTPALMLEVLALIGERYAAAPSRPAAQRIRTLVAAEAWTEAALALIDLELPQWTVRHLLREDGEWRCLLGKQWRVPEWLDDVVDVGHPVLPLALLVALIEARAVGSAAAEAPVRSVPPVRPVTREATSLCCDNFS